MRFQATPRSGSLATATTSNPTDGGRDDLRHLLALDGAPRLLTPASLAALPAVADAKNRDVLVRGVCTKSSAVKLVLSPEDGRIEVELEVDQNRNGVRWRVWLLRGRTRVFSGTATTRPPSGSFEVRRVVARSAGTVLIAARAVSTSTGEVCRAAARFA